MGMTRRVIRPSRAHQALLASTHHPLLQPPHSQLQTQPLQHPHPQPTRLWLRAQALLVPYVLIWIRYFTQWFHPV